MLLHRTASSLTSRQSLSVEDRRRPPVCVHDDHFKRIRVPLNGATLKRVLVDEIDHNRHRCAADARDAGDALDEDRRRNGFVERNPVQGRHHHMLARMTRGGNEGGLAHQVERVAAEQGAVMIRAIRNHHVDEAGFPGNGWGQRPLKYSRRLALPSEVR